MKYLVVVESPTKARTISRFLGKEYEIKASMGHVMDLPKSQLGIDLDHNFEPLYEIIEDKKKIIAELKKSAKDANLIILATDPDREGEAIASHVADMLISSSKFKVKSSKLRRIVFHEITNEAIQEALNKPRSIDANLVDAQTARRVLDRLVGYKLSPMLWRKVRRGLSAGRVQSVALRLIVEREREIEKFKKEEYWTISATLGSPHLLNDSSSSSLTQSSYLARANVSESRQNVASFKSSFRREARPALGNKDSTDFELLEVNGSKVQVQNTLQLYDGEHRVTKTTIETEHKANNIVNDLKTKEYQVSDVIKKEVRRSPQPPYTTSSLQQDASRRLGLNGKRTMSLAQKLYEEGYITYHRTDSVVISKTAQQSIIGYIKKEFGANYVPQKPRFYSAKQKLAQEAHEAIRPTKIGELQSQISNLKSQIGDSYVRLYEMIWRRAVASQMSDAIVESTTVLVDAQSDVILGSEETPESPTVQRDSGQARMTGDAYRLKANGSVLVFDGFLKVNPLGLSDNRLPQFKVAEKLNLIDVLKKEHETMPPPRYNDASIIKTLEEKGIGRPSTYATIVSTIEARQYIEREQGGRFIPTSIGTAVNDFLVANFSTIDDIPFTAQMEDDLDTIANGKKDWRPMIKDFYGPFEKKLEEVEGASRVKIAVEETDEKCPKCRSSLVIRTGRFGKFLSCSVFPKCKFSKPFVEETNFTCPKDRGKIVIKKTRKGRKFYSCLNYPKCDYAVWRLEDIKIL